jgi:predicted flap endonuclease-1-like 5' DNA nuclease
MPATKALPQFEAFGSYVDPFTAGESALSFWTEYWRAALDTTVWWTERWVQMTTAMIPSAFMPGVAAPLAASTRVTVVRPAASVIDLAQAAAARTSADVADAVAAAVEIVETAAEVPYVAAQDAAEVAKSSILVTPGAAADDLTVLVGIGPKLAAALAERGVTRFAQIAAWTEEDLAVVDKALDLKGRAVRDAWVAQAKRIVG